jgi:cytoskeletal protein CcmA (bactofilin family)
MMNSQKGQALPLALVALAIGILVVAPFLSQAGSSLIGSRIYAQSIDEQYSADAGVEYAIWQIQSGESEVPEGEELELPQFALNNKTVNVTIANEGGWTYKITSTATSDDGSSTTIEAYILLTIGFFDGDFTIFPGDFTLDRGEEYTGDIYVEGDVDIARDSTITGNVYAEGNINIARDATITGNVCAEGNITLNEGAVINGSVCAGGNVNLHNDAIINGDVHAVGNVDLAAGATINGDVHTGGNVQLAHGATITGDYPLPYEGCPLLGIGDIIIQTWEISRQ